jgi:hypothetical protein
MEDSYEHTEECALIDQPTSPPSYDDEPPAIQPPNVQAPLAPAAQPAPQMGQYPQIQAGGVLPQIWPQSYPVSSRFALSTIMVAAGNS